MDDFELWCIKNGVYKDSTGKWQVAEDEEEDNMDLESCPQCGEEAWDGYICHSCGAKDI